MKKLIISFLTISTILMLNSSPKAQPIQDRSLKGPNSYNHQEHDSTENIYNTHTNDSMHRNHNDGYMNHDIDKNNMSKDSVQPHLNNKKNIDKILKENRTIKDSIK